MFNHRRGSRSLLTFLILYMMKILFYQCISRSRVPASPAVRCGHRPSKLPLRYKAHPTDPALQLGWEWRRSGTILWHFLTVWPGSGSSPAASASAVWFTMEVMIKLMFTLSENPIVITAFSWLKGKSHKIFTLDFLINFPLGPWISHPLGVTKNIFENSRRNSQFRLLNWCQTKSVINVKIPGGQFATGVPIISGAPWIRIS